MSCKEKLMVFELCNSVPVSSKAHVQGGASGHYAAQHVFTRRPSFINIGEDALVMCCTDGIRLSLLDVETADALGCKVGFRDGGCQPIS